MVEIKNIILNYLWVPLLLLVVMLGYFRLAVAYRIIDKPNERSSHVTPTIRGGGIIFPITILLYFILSSFQYPYFAIAVLISGFISFLDDIKDMPRGVRFSIHVLTALLVLFQSGVFSLPVILILLAFILVVGVINAFNFMDGINGITGFYSLAILLPLMFTEQNSAILKLEVFFLFSLVLFLIFNARAKAKCFAGDVGSVTVAVIVSFLLVQRIVSTNDYTYLSFLALYLVDTGLTIIQRARAGEKILQAHRKHLFQVLSNEKGWSHLIVSLLYAISQLAINIFFVNTGTGIAGLVIMFVVLVSVYIYIKIRVLKSVS